MTQKELLYVEDALGHEQQLRQFCSDYAAQLQDPQLRGFVEGIGKRCGSSFERFMGLLNG